MTGPDEGCVRAIWAASTLRSLLGARGSALCPDVKHRGGSHGAEVNVLFQRHRKRDREEGAPARSLALSLSRSLSGLSAGMASRAVAGV